MERNAQTTSSGADSRNRLAPNTVNSVLPALESLQRISHSRQPSNGGASGPESAGGDGRTLNSSNTRTSTGAHGGYLSAIPSHLRPSTQSSTDSHQQVFKTYSEASADMSSSGSGHPSGSQDNSNYSLESQIPDILHSHMISPNSGHSHHRSNRARPRHSSEALGRPRRNRHRPRGERSRHGQRRRSRNRSSSSSQLRDGACKEPCVKCVVAVFSFRWVLIVLSVLGVCCVVTGIVLAALQSSGSSFLFLAIMFIGLGVLLVIVVGVGWKCTPRGHEPLHALLGIGQFQQGGQTRERPHRRHRSRDSNWFGGVMYPEFQYRRPPPSYAASMQDYQSHHSESSITPALVNERGGDSSLPGSPPPSYRSRTSTMHSGTHIQLPGDDMPSSRPPTYRSRAPSRRPSLPRDNFPDSDSAPADIHFGGGIGTDRPAGSENDSVVVAISSIPLSSSSNQQASPSTIIPIPNSQLDSSVPSTIPTHNTSVPLSSTVTSTSDSRNVLSSMQNTQNLTETSGERQSIPAPNSSCEDRNLRAPALHQRMESGDRVQLEKALQSLEEHMNEIGGIVNPAINVENADALNTHL